MAEDRDVNAVEYRGRMKPNPARGPRCLYCGEGRPWWECECPAVLEVKAGKRAKPKVVFREGRPIIVVDAETAKANVLGFERYEWERPKAAEDDGEKAEVGKAKDRAAYMRDYMQKKRARRREGA